MQCFMKKEGKRLIDVENVDYRRNVLQSELTNTIEQFLKRHFIYNFLLFLFRSGAPPMTLRTAGALATDARLVGVGRVRPPPPILATTVSACTEFDRASSRTAVKSTA